MTSQTDVRTSITTTEFAEYFPVGLLEQRNVHPTNVQLLKSGEAKLRWSKQFGPDAKSYFSIPADSWLVTSPATTIGLWINDYNSGNSQRTATKLRSQLPWVPTTPVLFCVGHRTIIATTWDIFTTLWDCFLAVHDDCPIVVPDQKGPRSALIFTPLGEIRHVREAKAKDPQR
jgi:hypothetical protein